MGLDTTHGCWHGAYSAFMRWREKICEVAGLGDIHQREGFGGGLPWPEDDPLSIFFITRIAMARSKRKTADLLLTDWNP